LFGPSAGDAVEWPTDRAVVDGFGDLPIKHITSLLTAVGLGSPPAWIKPYGVLSNGEQFRCDLARRLAVSHSADPSTCADRPVVAFDEFTSVVDRNVARIASAALAKALRQDQLSCRFVAVTCHYDVAEWLEPDWTIDMSTCAFHRRRLRRPRITLQVFRCHRRLWAMFARHHYLTGSLPNAARCYIALWEGVAVAFCATVSLIGHQRRWRISRLVTLPDYQGVGIGMRLAETVAELHGAQQERVNVTASHPSLIRHCLRSPRWRRVGLSKGGRPGRRFIANYRGSPGRSVVSFEYIGGPSEPNAS
jgi:GNAT superfamily N-acetyltransferase